MSFLCGSLSFGFLWSVVINFLPDLYHLLDVVWRHRLLIRLYWRVRTGLVVGLINEYLICPLTAPLVSTPDVPTAVAGLIMALFIWDLEILAAAAVLAVNCFWPELLVAEFCSIHPPAFGFWYTFNYWTFELLYAEWMMVEFWPTNLPLLFRFLNRSVLTMKQILEICNGYF